MCSRNSDCPTLLIGDFNCRLDCGEMGYDLCDMLYSVGFVCLNNPNDMTYIAAQGQSCIDLAVVTSSHSHQFEAHVEASLEKKDQHLVVGWDKSISRLSSRVPAVRHVDCGHISETFDSDNFSCAFSEGAVDAAYDQILGSIKHSEIIVAKPRRAKPWFDGECLVLKRAIRASYRVICVSSEQVLRLEHANLVRSFQTLKRHKMRAYEDRMQERAIMRAESDSMDFWRLWKGNRACGARMNVTPGAWEAHFLELFSAESPPILQRITEHEVRIAIERGKNGKASGPDCLTNERP